MKRNIYIWILLLMVAISSCSEKGIEDIDQDQRVLLLKNPVSDMVVTIADNTWEAPELDFRLMGKKLDKDLTITLTVDGESTISNDDIVFESTKIVLKSGESYTPIKYTVKKSNFNEGDVKKLKVNVTTDDPNIKVESIDITIKAKLFDLEYWLGDYNFHGNDWKRDYIKIKPVEGESYKCIIYGFWGAEIDMPAEIDFTDLSNPKFVIKAGVKLSDGWNAQGDWYFKDDLIGVFDKANKKIVFTQFNYITDDGTTGSFPWCANRCEIIKK